MKKIILTLALAAGLTSFAGNAKADFTADLTNPQDFTQGIGSTGWSGAYGGNNTSSAFNQGNGLINISDQGGSWASGANSGHALYISVTGDFVATTQFNSYSFGYWNGFGIGAFDHSNFTGTQDPNWIQNFIDAPVGPTGGIMTRLSSGQNAGNYGGGSTGMPQNIWLQLARKGDIFRSSYSLNGSDFSIYKEITKTLPGTVDVGLAVASYTGGTASASFSNFSVVNTVPEPSTYALFALGALALVVAYRRRVA
jgi:regulation of enolase protein 1 (concanavalin A-like superfamily)